MHMRPSVAVRNVMSRRDLYSFVEISQNNQDYMGARGHAHYENLIDWRVKINSAALGPMPMNNEKVYGARAGENRSAGSGQEAVARFWRNIFGGSAASRFHRPAAPAHWGLGLGEAAQVNLKAMTMLIEELDIFACAPGNHLLTPVIRSTEAYCLANIGKQYAVYFPEGRYLVDLDPWVFVTELRVRWLDIERGVWLAGQTVPVNWEALAPDASYRENEIRDNLRGRITLATPNNRPHVALLEVIE
jgi:hypothetical protein